METCKLACQKPNNVLAEQTEINQGPGKRQSGTEPVFAGFPNFSLQALGGSIAAALTGKPEQSGELYMVTGCFYPTLQGAKEQGHSEQGTSPVLNATGTQTIDPARNCITLSTFTAALSGRELSAQNQAGSSGLRSSITTWLQSTSPVLVDIFVYTFYGSNPGQVGTFCLLKATLQCLCCLQCLNARGTMLQSVRSLLLSARQMVCWPSIEFCPSAMLYDTFFSIHFNHHQLPLQQASTQGCSGLFLPLAQRVLVFGVISGYHRNLTGVSMDPPQEQQVSAIPISSTQSRGSSADGAAAHRRWLVVEDIYKKEKQEIIHLEKLNLIRDARKLNKRPRARPGSSSPVSLRGTLCSEVNRWEEASQSSTALKPCSSLQRVVTSTSAGRDLCHKERAERRFLLEPRRFDAAAAFWRQSPGSRVQKAAGTNQESVLLEQEGKIQAEQDGAVTWILVSRTNPEVYKGSYGSPWGAYRPRNQWKVLEESNNIKYR
ncbi:hypothetical protein Anapl_06908 [Anas platyrhynchos]|uniref:Uncharacterized protein n=1 Tax=Anas platyrhynchos TaxID=8839 RepID=R0L3I5_ANAPL|nr:hypothetical protein Anapl_06908 [Anas platyrhynchos]